MNTFKKSLVSNLMKQTIRRGILLEMQLKDEENNGMLTVEKNKYSFSVNWFVNKILTIVSREIRSALREQYQQGYAQGWKDKSFESL